MRRRLVAAGLIVAMLCLMAGCGKQESAIYIMADVQEGDHPTAIACDKFAEMVYERTDGRIKIEVYHGDTLGQEVDQITQVAAGGIDFARLSTMVSTYEPRLTAFQLPYLFESEDAMWEVLKGPIGDELLKSESLAENNIEGLCWFSGGSRNFYNSQREIRQPSDLSGLTIRVNTDSMIKLVENCGGTPMNILYSDVYDALKDGLIDGAENNWPSYISTGHYEEAKYITIDQHVCIPEMIVASKSALDSMSAEDRAIVEECALEISDYQFRAMEEYEEEAIEIAEEAGCVITELTDDEVAAFLEAGAEVNAEVGAEYADVIEWLTGK